MEENYSWIYLLIFLIIPLARILPRVLKRAGLKQNISTRPESPRENFFQESSPDRFQESSPDRFQESSPDNFEESPRKEEFSTKNWSKEKIVLGLLMTNISKFEELQKRANLSTNNLDTILQDFEKKRLMMPVEKSSPFGKSIQLKITEKGAAEFRRM
jgi:predicted transcriptional regulator|tara:strand:+ start:275 stop:748 length:474 start_codon:yes stop_codon:yes gene_type:complete